MMSIRAVVAVLAVVVAAVVAEPGYGRPAPTPCHPKIQYVTKYQTQVQQVSALNYTSLKQ